MSVSVSACLCVHGSTCSEQTLAASLSLSLGPLLGQIRRPELWNGIVETILGDPNADPDDLKVPTPYLHEAIAEAMKSDCCTLVKLDMCMRGYVMDLYLGLQLNLCRRCMQLTTLTCTRVYEQPIFE